MKRVFLMTVAGLMLASPMAAPAFAQQPYPQQQQQYGDHGRDQNGRGQNDNDRHDDHDRGPNGQNGNQNQSHGNVDWRDTRPDARWDDHQHNGYYIRNTWHPGAPPPSAYHKRGFQLAWRPWHKGDRLGAYNTRYTEVDYRSRHLRAPPRGYHYVQTDNGDVLLAALATGIIASIILSNN